MYVEIIGVKKPAIKIQEVICCINSGEK